MLLAQTLPEQSRSPDPSFTEAKDNEADVQPSLPPSRIHGLCTNFFAKGEAGSDYSKEEIIDSHAVWKEAFLRNAGNSKRSLELADVKSPSPITVPRAKLEEIAELQPDARRGPRDAICLSSARQSPRAPRL